MDTQWSTYNATDKTFIVPADNVRFFQEIYPTTAFHGTFFGTTFVTFVAFLLFSTRRERTKCTFYALTTAFLVLLTTSILTLSWISQRQSDFLNDGSTKIDPSSRFNDVQFSIASMALEKLTCLTADIALIFKLLTLLPTQVYSSAQRHIRILPLLICIPPRVALIIAYPILLVRGQVHRGIVVSICDFAIQIAHCVYASGLLVYMSSSFAECKTSHGKEKLRCIGQVVTEALIFTLFVPVCFQIACLTILAADDNPNAHEIRYYHASNTYLTVLSALLSSSWSIIRSRVSTTDHSDGSSTSTSPNFINTFFTNGEEDIMPTRHTHRRHTMVASGDEEYATSPPDEKKESDSVPLSAML